MNDPDAAGGQVAEDDTQGAEPELTFNAHIAPPEGGDEQGEHEEQAADSPSDDEGNVEKTEPEGDPKQRKVHELAFENRQLKRELDALKTQADADPQQEAEPLKTLKDFNYDEQAFNEYLVDETSTRTAAKLSRGNAQTDAQRQQDEFAAREEAFEVDSPGFSERLHADDLAITPEMAQFITDPESDVGLHVGDFLSKNKDEATRIASLSPTAQAREMTKLESRIGREVAKVKAAKTKASDAPRPSPGIDGQDAGLRRSPSDPATADEMSDPEWLAARQKQLSK